MGRGRGAGPGESWAEPASKNQSTIPKGTSTSTPETPSFQNPKTLEFLSQEQIWICFYIKHMCAHQALQALSPAKERCVGPQGGRGAHTEQMLGFPGVWDVAVALSSLPPPPPPEPAPSPKKFLSAISEPFLQRSLPLRLGPSSRHKGPLRAVRRASGRARGASERGKGNALQCKMPQRWKLRATPRSHLPRRSPTAMPTVQRAIFPSAG